MAQIDKTEQWLLDGDCDLCRKKKHCGKQCKQSKLADRRQIVSLAHKVVGQALFGKSE